MIDIELPDAPTAELLAENKRLRAALEKYADRDNWPDRTVWTGGKDVVEKGMGWWIAKRALEAK